jgi:hypothetical protein
MNEFQLGEIIPRKFHSAEHGSFTLMIDLTARSVLTGRRWRAANLPFDKVQDEIYRIVEARLRDTPELRSALADGDDVDICGTRPSVLFSAEELEALKRCGHT